LTGDVEKQPMGVVICCRRKEYEEIVRKRLDLCNSVALQPLSDKQIENYLTQFRLGTVWDSVQASPKLQDLLQKPLFLAVFGFISPQFDFSEWQRRTNDADRIEYLFDRYWDVTMNRMLVDTKSQDQRIQSKIYGKRALPSHKKVRRAIVFAAKAMAKESKIELLIEEMQPAWLRNEFQKWQYKLIFVSIVALIGGLIGGLIGEPTEGLIFIPILLLIKELLGWFIKGLFKWLYFGGGVLGLVGLKPIGWVVTGLFGWLGLPDDVLLMLLVVLIVGLVVALVVGLVVALIRWLIFAPIVGLLGWLVFKLTVWLIRKLKSDIEIKSFPNQRIKNSGQNMFVLTGAALLIAIPLKPLLELLMASILSPAQLSTTVVTVSLFCFIWLSFSGSGGETVLKHVSLRIVLSLYGYAPYRYDKLLDYCTERLLLQRIGGRYRFMHKLLQEHFAKMPLD
jgi:hypothetical protein